MVKDHKLLSLRDQLKLLDLNRSSFYYKPIENEDFLLIKKIDQIYTDCPFYGSRRICAVLKQEDFAVNIKACSKVNESYGY